ncbi:NUDIX hydrolase [Sporolactobacillus vineae]|uniref:NUDIX hydrolase n=1 Tax=Sporolactobacillus vineae TaxID=444463 RepID=UPI000289612E|nr:8-oxo-dGTP diphosphatase [Sporolactobacillus vineae]
MLRYTLALIRKNDKFLMINREKSPWQGAWNGIGGKLEPGETATACVIREIREETGLQAVNPVFRGIVTWHADGEARQGMYLFIVNAGDIRALATPKRTREGVLEWKTEAWLLSEKNFGTVPTLRCFMREVLQRDNAPKEYHCYFDGDTVIKRQISPLTVKIE